MLFNSKRMKEITTLEGWVIWVVNSHRNPPNGYVEAENQKGPGNLVTKIDKKGKTFWIDGYGEVNDDVANEMKRIHKNHFPNYNPLYKITSK